MISCSQKILTPHCYFYHSDTFLFIIQRKWYQRCHSHSPHRCSHLKSLPLLLCPFDFLIYRKGEGRLLTSSMLEGTFIIDGRHRRSTLNRMGVDCSIYGISFVPTPQLWNRLRKFNFYISGLASWGVWTYLLSCYRFFKLIFVKKYTWSHLSHFVLFLN